MCLAKIAIFLLFFSTVLSSCQGAGSYAGKAPHLNEDSTDVGDVQLLDSGLDTGGKSGLDLGQGDVGQPKDMDKKEPPIISDLTVIVRTEDFLNGGTNDLIELCVNETTCFPLAVQDVSTSLITGRNATAVIHFRNLNVLESDVEYVKLRTTELLPEESNAWLPKCLALRFNGEPRYCNDKIDVVLGIGSDTEIESWTDPAGLHEACMTCEDSLIPQGPIQGAHTQNTANFWIRSDASRELKMRVGENADLSDGVIKYQTIPDSANDYVNRITIEGLNEGTTYFYQFEVGSEFKSDIFSFKTLEAVGVNKKVQFVVGSCTSIVDEQPVFERIAELSPKPDLFIFGGDTHYANSYRRDAQSIHWQRMRRAEGQSKVTAQISTISTWDDHDFSDNNSNGTCKGIEETTKSFVDSWANPDVDVSKGIYYKHRVGPAEVFMLDCRTHRPDVSDPQNMCVKEAVPPVFNIEDGMLGIEQTSWLLSELEGSSAVFKVLVCGSQWIPDGSLDSWKSFPEAQKYLFSELTRLNITGVVLVDGDVHRSEFSDIPREDGYVLPALTASNLARNDREATDPVCDNNRRFRTFCYPDLNYMSLSFDDEVEPAKLVASIVDEAGVSVGTRTIFENELEGNGVARKIEVKVKTNLEANSNTADPVEVCLGSHCFPFPAGSLNTLGGEATFELDDLRIPISSINEVSLHSLSPSGTDNDSWQPTCLEIAVNNQLEYCMDGIDRWIGTGPGVGEIERWTDSLGLHTSCMGCP